MKRKDCISFILYLSLLVFLFACNESGGDSMSSSKNSYMLAVDKHSIELGFEDGSSDTIIIEAPNTRWEVVNTVDWITVTPSSGKGNNNIVIIAKENFSFDDPRSTVVQIRSIETDFSGVQDIHITQREGKPYVIPEKTELRYENKESSSTIKVKSNIEWHIVVNEVQPWVEIIKDENSIQLNMKANGYLKRQTWIHLYDKDNHYHESILIVQEAGTPYLLTDKAEIECDAERHVETISVESNVDWTANYASWINIYKENDKLKIVVNKNESSERTANIIFRIDTTILFNMIIKQNSAANSADSDMTYDITGVSSWSNTIKTARFTMKKVEAGSFYMGVEYSSIHERPVHKVTLSKDYYLGETEVTRALWEVVGVPPLVWEGSNDDSIYDEIPINYVSYDTCQQFLIKLNQIVNGSFRLPTEAEWNFAANSGNYYDSYYYNYTKYSGSDYIDKVAWYKGNSNDFRHFVKKKSPNKLGLYDMNGNVSEWCNDWLGDYEDGSQIDPKGPETGTYRVVRGGCYAYSSEGCTNYWRDWELPSSSSGLIGFRIAM